MSKTTAQSVLDDLIATFGSVIDADEEINGGDAVEQVCRLYALAKQVQVKDGVGVYQYLDVSIGHISQETASYLEQVSTSNELGLSVANHGIGFFVSVPAEADYQDNVPEDLQGVLEFARLQGCLVIRLDADGARHERLPVFSW